MQLINKGKEIKEKIKIAWFIMLIIGTIAQTVLTFYLLYRQSKSEFLNKVIFVLLITYVLAFMVIVLMSLHARKISPEAMRGFKRSQKSIKNILTLLMLVLAIINLVGSRGNMLELILSIIMLIYNLIVIYIDAKITKIADRIIRKKKKREREEREAEIRAYRIGDKKRKKENQNE